MTMRHALLTPLLIAALAAPSAAQVFEAGLHLQTGATNVSGMRYSGLGLRAGASGAVALIPQGRLKFAAEAGYARYGQVARVRLYDDIQYLNVREAAAFHRIEFSPLLEVRVTGWLSLAGGPVLGLMLGGRVRTLVETTTNGNFSRRVYTERLGGYYTNAGFGVQVRAGFRVTDGLWIDLSYVQGLHDTARWWTGASRAIPQGLLAGLRWLPLRKD